MSKQEKFNNITETTDNNEKIRELVELYNKNPDKIYQVYDYKSIPSIGIMNAEVRATDESIEPIWGEAKNGDFIAFPLADNIYALVPKPGYIFNKERYLRGSFGYIFDYLNFKKEKENYDTEFKVIKPSLFKFNDNVRKWECVQKGMLGPSKQGQWDQGDKIEIKEEDKQQKDVLNESKEKTEPEKQPEPEVKEIKPKKAETEEDLSLDENIKNEIEKWKKILSKNEFSEQEAFLEEIKKYDNKSQLVEKIESLKNSGQYNEVAYYQLVLKYKRGEYSFGEIKIEEKENTPEIKSKKVKKTKPEQSPEPEPEPEKEPVKSEQEQIVEEVEEENLRGWINKKYITTTGAKKGDLVSFRDREGNFFQANILHNVKPDAYDVQKTKKIQFSDGTIKTINPLAMTGEELFIANLSDKDKQNINTLLQQVEVESFGESEKQPEPEVTEPEIEQVLSHEEAVLKFGEIRKKLERFTVAREELTYAEKKGKGIEQAQEKYEKLKAEYVGEKIWRDLKEQERLTESKAEEFKGLFRKFYEWSSNKYLIPKSWVKTMEEWQPGSLVSENLIKKIQDWQPESKIGKVGKFSANIATKLASLKTLANIGIKLTSVRNITSYGLLGAGIAAGATGIGAGAAFGAIALRRGLSGVGTGFGMYNTLNRIVDWRESKKDVNKELNEQELNNISQKEIIDRLEYFEAKARVRGQKVKELIDYRNYRNLKLELNQRFREKFEVKGQEKDEKQAGFVKSWLTKTRQQINENLKEHYEKEKTKDKKIKTAAIGAGVFTGIGGIRITGKGVFDLIKGEGASGFIKAGTQEFNVYKTLFLGKEQPDIDEINTITSAAPKPEIIDTTQLQELKPKFETVLADSNLSDTTKTAIQDSLEKLTPEQQAKILPTITQTDTLDKTFAHTDTSEQIQKKIQELTGVKLETPKPEIIPEKITLPPIEAVVQKGEGVIHSLQRQLLADSEKFGYDKSSGIDVKDWASKIANHEGMKNYGETWVKEPGKVAYVLEGNEKIGFSIKEVSPETGKIIGASETFDTDHEMKPIKKEPDFLDKKPIIEELKIKIPKHEYPSVQELDTNENIIDYENQYEDAVTPADKSHVVKSFEKYLEKQGGIENINQINNAEMLQELSKSKNESIAFISDDTKEMLLSQGSPTERVVNFLELENPTPKDLRIIRSTFEQFGKTITSMSSWDNFKPQHARLLANYVTQSGEVFRNSVGAGNYLNNAFHDFIAKAGVGKMPVNEIWQPRIESIPDGKGGVIDKIFNVKPQNHLHKSTDYLIDFGDGQKPKLVQENTLQDILDGKSNFDVSETGPAPVVENDGNELAKQVGDIPPEPVKSSEVDLNSESGYYKNVHSFGNKLAFEVYKGKIDNADDFIGNVKKIVGRDLTPMEEKGFRNYFKAYQSDPKNPDVMQRFRNKLNFNLRNMKSGEKYIPVSEQTSNFSY